MSDNSYVPPANVEIYKILFTIEVGLREYIIAVLSEKFGQKWWKQRLPQDILQTFKDSRSYERNIKWTQFVSHHPIYYTDFPDIKKIIIRQDNWRDVFQYVFKSSEVITGSLTSLEPIRNKVAHNRRATLADVDISNSALRVVSTALGEDKLYNYVNNCNEAMDIITILRQLKMEMITVYQICLHASVLEYLPTWNLVNKSWWFDDDYLLANVSNINNFFSVVIEYTKIIRLRGDGYKIEKWLNENKITELYTLAEQELLILLNNVGV